MGSETKEKKNKKSTSTLLGEVASFARKFLLDHLPPQIVFHDLNHTLERVDVLNKMFKEIALDENEKEQLLIAAWFADLGYAESPKKPYARSVELSHHFLEEKNFTKEAIRTIEKLIFSLQKDREPETPAEKILHDAEWAFVGRKRFNKKAPLLRLEREFLGGEKYDLSEWTEEMLDLLLKVQFRTAYGITRFNQRRIQNIADQRGSMGKAKEKTLKLATGKNLGRGIDTLYRTAFRNHINLSRIADGKANMMISINTIVLSIIIGISSAGFSFLENYFWDSPIYMLPIVTLLLSSLTALVFAVFSARPSITEYNLEEKQKLKKNKNISFLYFGNFLQLDKKEFISYLDGLKKDQHILYEDLSKDLYDLGNVLQKKYRLLTISYNIFVGGLILSVLFFFAVYLIFV